MFRRPALFLVSCLGLTLVAGTHKLTIVLWNDSNETVVALVHDESLSIPQGQRLEFDYPSPEQNWTLRLLVGPCEALYVAPRNLQHYIHFPEYVGSVKAQLEADLSIHLAPKDASQLTPPATLVPLQVDGFSLQPIQKHCGG